MLCNRLEYSQKILKEDSLQAPCIWQIFSLANKKSRLVASSPSRKTGSRVSFGRMRNGFTPGTKQTNICCAPAQHTMCMWSIARGLSTHTMWSSAGGLCIQHATRVEEKDGGKCLEKSWDLQGSTGRTYWAFYVKNTPEPYLIVNWTFYVTLPHCK